jgi:O-antigen biosynthesis protein
MISSRYDHPGRVTYIREDRPGLGRAHNSGMEKVTAPIAAFTDDDVIADPRWLASLAGNFEQSPKIGCVTGLILPAELETRAQFWTERHGGFSKGFQRKVFDLEQQRPAAPLFPYTAGQFGSGANMAFRMDALRQIGGFDSALGAGTLARGGDDLASFFAVVTAGYQLVYEPCSNRLAPSQAQRNRHKKPGVRLWHGPWRLSDEARCRGTITASHPRTPVACRSCAHDGLHVSKEPAPA